MAHDPAPRPGPARPPRSLALDRLRGVALVGDAGPPPHRLARPATPGPCCRAGGRSPVTDAAAVAFFVAAGRLDGAVRGAAGAARGGCGAGASGPRSCAPVRPAGARSGWRSTGCCWRNPLMFGVLEALGVTVVLGRRPWPPCVPDRALPRRRGGGRLGPACGPRGRSRAATGWWATRADRRGSSRCSRTSGFVLVGCGGRARAAGTPTGAGSRRPPRSRRCSPPLAPAGRRPRPRPLPGRRRTSWCRAWP